MNLLPLGTVIQIDNNKAFIIGYSSIEQEKNKKDGYFVVSYPLGFTSIDKVLFIPWDFEFKILAEGYKTEFSKKMLNTIAKCVEVTRTTSYEDLSKFNRLYKDYLLRIKRGTVK